MVSSPPSTVDAAGASAARLLQSGRARQVDLDGRAVAFLAVDLDVAAGLLDEAVHHAEAEAGALADLLGGEEGLEHPFEQLPAACRVPVSLTAIIT